MQKTFNALNEFNGVVFRTSIEIFNAASEVMKAQANSFQRDLGSKDAWVEKNPLSLAAPVVGAVGASFEQNFKAASHLVDVAMKEFGGQGAAVAQWQKHFTNFATKATEAAVVTPRKVPAV